MDIKVLAIDSDENYLNHLVSLLRNCKYEVTARRHATEALKLIRENNYKFNLVIIDIERLDMDGFKLLDIIKREMNIAVILMSTNEAKVDWLRCMEVGVDRLVPKPMQEADIWGMGFVVLRRTLSLPRERDEELERNTLENKLIKEEENKDEISSYLKNQMENKSMSYEDTEEESKDEASSDSKNHIRNKLITCEDIEEESKDETSSDSTNHTRNKLITCEEIEEESKDEASSDSTNHTRNKLITCENIEEESKDEVSSDLKNHAGYNQMACEDINNFIVMLQNEIRPDDVPPEDLLPDNLCTPIQQIVLQDYLINPN